MEDKQNLEEALIKRNYKGRPDTRKVLHVKMTDEMNSRVAAARNKGPYRLTVTSIVHRGIELALAELENIGNGKD